MTRQLRGFQVESLGTGFTDGLNNSSIHSNWTTDITDVTGPDPTIAEDGTGLTISYVGGNSEDVDWYFSSPINAPNVNLALEPQDFLAKVFIDSFTAQNNAGAGIAHYLVSDKAKCHVVNIEDDAGSDYVRTHYNSSNEQSTGSPSGEVWLAVMRRGFTIDFFYSTNAFGSEPDLADMTHIRRFNQAFAYAYNRLALFAASRGTGYPSISPRFRKFSLIYST